MKDNKVCPDCGTSFSASAIVCQNCGSANKLEASLRKKRQIFIAIGIAIAAIAIYAAPGSDTSKEAVAPGRVVPIIELINAYDANEVAADGQYGGERVRTWGAVKNVGVLMGQPYVVLNDGAHEAKTDFQGLFDEDQRRLVGNLSKGDTVSVECTIDKMLMNLMADHCVFISPH
ncbi:hypothetical protein RAM80_07450 [Pseudomonas sp. App30]|uniref:OB-fold protein n=1 Tax=Pseudomonas sp. App30 TaxID=3068990 RepID=UPI003A8091ED